MNAVLKLFLVNLITIQKITSIADLNRSIGQHWNTGIVAIYNQPNLFGINWTGQKITPSANRLVRLYSSKNKKFLQIQKNHVNAKGLRPSVYTKLSIESVGYGLIRIKGIEANRYICFNPINAELIVQKNGNNLSCVFEELYSEKSFRTFFKSKLKNWYIAIKNNGKIRPGDLWPNSLKIPPKTMEFIAMTCE